MRCGERSTGLGRRLGLWGLAAGALLLAACVRLGVRPAEVPFVARGRQAMVASADQRATAAGVRMLRAGGNAADALAAVSFALSVVRPQSTGLGGGGFAVLYLAGNAAERRALAIDFRERAPAAAGRDMFADPRLPQDASLFGPLAVATPGLVAGVMWIHERYGRLPRRTVLAPAVALAEDGFRVYPGLARALARMAPVLGRYPESARVFLSRGGPPPAGSLLRQPELARTLRALAAGGAREFYAGSIGQAIAAEVQRQGGILAPGDLAAYRVVERPVVRGYYHGFEIIGMPPPSSGGVLLVEMLHMLAAAGPGAGEGTRADAAHLLAEVMRRAYEDRAVYLGDPDFVDVPVRKLLSPSFAAARLRDFNPHQASRRPARAGGGTSSPNTTHISILDAEGNAVAATETINYSFGSGIVVPGTGVLLNDEMDDFATQPGVPNVYGLWGGEANAIAPGKTPLSSMSPTIVMRGGVPVLIVGSPGGSLIITATLQTILNVIDRHLPLPAAVAAPRIHHQAFPNRIDYEPGAFDGDVKADLERRGHVLRQAGPMGDVQAVMRLPGGDVVGVSDPRGEGRPGGY